MKLVPQRRAGVAVLVVLALLGILSLYVLVNARTLMRLKHDVRQVELRQLQRLHAVGPLPGASAPATNSPASSSLNSPPTSAPLAALPVK